MQKYVPFLFLFLLNFSDALLAQNVGIGTPTPNVSAKLDITSTNSGLLIPRISLIDVTNGVTPVATPATGLLVFNTNAAITGGSGIGFYYWDGTIWARVQDVNFSGGGGAGWSLTGNGGTNPTTNFLGTTDAQDLVFRTNNTEKMRVLSNGNVGIGIASTAYKLDIVGPGGGSTNLRVNGRIWLNSPGGGIWLSDAQDGFVGNQDAARFGFWSSSVGWNTLSITKANGNVGIGTASPLNQLHVDGGANNAIARISSNAGYAENLYSIPTGSWEVGTNNSGNGTSNNQFYIYDNAYRLTVQKGTGNVGIGTVTPEAGLHVVSPEVIPFGLGVFSYGGAGGNAGIEIRGGAYPHIDFSNDPGSDYDLRLIQGAEDMIQLQGGQLFVNGFRAVDDYGNVGTFLEDAFGLGDTWFANGFNPYSIRASHWVIGAVFASYSDKRIKKDIRLANNRQSLDLLKTLKVSHYKHIDAVQNGPYERMGFIAQEVEAIFPEAVTRMEHVLPNIYQIAGSVTYNKDESTLSVSVGDYHFKKGDRVQLFLEGDSNPTQVTVTTGGSGQFSVEGWTTDVQQVFVYGTEVDDFKAVDYDRIFILGVSAIQELDKKVSELENLKEEIASIRSEIEALKK